MPVKQAEVASLIKESVRSLLESRKQLGGGRFTDADHEWGARCERGPMASMQGLRTIFSVVVALAEHPIDILNVVEPDRASLLDEWKEVLSRFEKEGYHADPYDPGGILKGLIAGGGRNAYYIEAVSWALSTSVLINCGITLWTQIRSLRREDEVIEATRRQVLTSLRLLLDSQCRDGGWSWCPGVAQGNLFFTWSGVEGLADFYDYIMGESEKECGIGADEEMIEFLRGEEPAIFERTSRARENACAFLAERYLRKAVEQDLVPDDVSDGESIFFESRNRLVMVYYELYLLEALIIAGYDIPGGTVSRANRDQLEMLYRNISRKFPQMRSPQFADDPEASTLRFEIRGGKAYKGKVPTWAVQDAGLWPQLLRTMVLYRFYTKQDRMEDPDIVGERDSALRLLLDSRRPVDVEWGGLWDTTAFNLAVTARGVEGLIDCYDYFDLLRVLHERRVGEPKAGVAARLEGGELAVVLADAVYPHIETRLKEVVGPERPVREEAASVEDLIQQLRSEVGRLIKREDLGAKIVEIVGDCAEPFKPWNGVTPDEILKRLLGERRAEDLDVENRDAYNLLKLLVWVSFCASVRLLHVIWQEAVLYQQTDQEVLSRFRRKDSSEGEPPLGDRLRLALKAIMENEMDCVHLPPDARPSYDTVVKKLLGRTPGRGPK